MPSFVPFFEKACHQVAKLQAAYPARPRLASLKLAMWAFGKAATGHVLGDVTFTRASGNSDELHLAFILRGGIGDVIINLSWVEALTVLARTSCRVDLLTNTPEDCITALCWGKAYVRRVMTLKKVIPLAAYDAVFDVMQNPQVRAVCRERLAALSPSLLDYVRRLLAFQSSHASFYTDENQAMGIHYADVMGGGRRRQPDFDGSLDLRNSAFMLQCREHFAGVADRFGLERPYVTIQREAGSSSRSLKLWSAEKYTALVAAMQDRFPGYDLVLVGLEKTFEMPAGKSGHVMDLRGRTSFGELMSLVRHAFLHVGGEGLVPHLRHFLHGGPSLVLFGPSCARMLGYPENLALSGSECPNGCEGIVPSWQQRCLKGYDRCRSLDEIEVEDVLRACERAGMGRECCSRGGI